MLACRMLVRSMPGSMLTWCMLARSMVKGEELRCAMPKKSMVGGLMAQRSMVIVNEVNATHYHDNP